MSTGGDEKYQDYTLLLQFARKKNSSMELAVIGENFGFSDLGCFDLACSDLTCSDLSCFLGDLRSLV